MNKPIVFVSSVVSGLERTRSLVQDLIKGLGYDVIISESEGSKPRTPLSQCRKWACECDIYICILSKKYGMVVPKLGISVTEIEFYEAHQDNPEKILVYVSAEDKERRQTEFVKRIEGFTEGYFRRKPFLDEVELINGIKDDLASFMKERLDIIRKNRIKVRPTITPSLKEYVAYSIGERAIKMRSDIADIAKELGFERINLFGRQTWQFYTQSFQTMSSAQLYTGKRDISGNPNILFTIWALPERFNVGTYKEYEQVSQRYIHRSKQYGRYPSRFTIFFIHRPISHRSLESIVRMWSDMTCFKVEPGLFLGTSFGAEQSEGGTSYYENSLFLTNIRNKEIMLGKLSNALEWLNKEGSKINFRCNYINGFNFPVLPYHIIARARKR